MPESKHFNENYVSGMADAAYKLVASRGATLAYPGRTLATLTTIVAWALDDGFEKGVAAQRLVKGMSEAETGTRTTASPDVQADRSARRTEKSQKRAVAAFDRGYDAGKLLGVAEGRAELLAEMAAAVARNNEQRVA